MSQAKPKKPNDDSTRGKHALGKNNRFNPEPKTPCPYYLKPKGCYKGDKCKFSHDLKGKDTSARGAPKRREESEFECSFREWSYLIPRLDVHTRRQVHDTDAQKFFEMGWKLMSKEDVGTRQQIVTKLGTEQGILMIKALTDLMVDDRPGEYTTRVFKRITLPFYRIVSHPDVLSSLILESSVDTICNFLFGPSGRRAIITFRFAAQALSALALDGSLEDQEQFSIGLTATLALLQRIVDLNQSAQIIEEFTPIVEKFSACMPERTDLHAAQRSLDRIRRRLGFGATFPSMTVGKLQSGIHRATFELSQDLPGTLSKEGPRHDNDHENIRDIKILPTALEIQSHRQEYLPSKDPTRNHHSGLEGLLDRQFRLLREDTIGQLRDAVRLELEAITRPPSARLERKREDQATRKIVYQNVCLLHLTIDKRKGLQIIIDFDQPAVLRNKSAKQRENWWRDSKQLLAGALVCLISSQGRTIFFSVSDPTPTPLSKEQAQTEKKNSVHGAKGESRRKQDQLPSLFNHVSRAALMVSMVEYSPSDLSWIMHHLKQRALPRQCLVEFPGILLPAFRPTLQALQRMSRTLDLPFSEFIAPENQITGVTDVKPPAYTENPGFTFNLEILTQGSPLEFKPGKPFDFEKLNRVTKLDRAQQNCVVHALSRGLALIQGPPGTGKSYTGVAIIKTLLRNHKKANIGPIVCVCYTNHALDQLLEHLIQDGVEQVIRLGSRSKSESLRDLNLRHVSQEMEQTKTEKHDKWALYTELDEDVTEIEDLLSDLNNPSSWTNIKAHLEDNHHTHFQEMFGLGFDEAGFRTVRGKKYNLVSSWLKGAPKGTSSKRSLSQLQTLSLREMSASERKDIHSHWIEQRSAKLQNDLLIALDFYHKRKAALDKCNQELNLRCLLQAQVIGVTTSGLAGNLDLLRRVRAKVMVCEEAGEVLEAHTLTAFLPSVEHAVLIGDHEQLRPHINNHELQHDHPRGEKFSLDISLFERLVKPQSGYPKVPYSTLKTQRRMHPSIAELVRLTLYPRLEDHPSVSEYPAVDGMRDRLFWLNHQEKEDLPGSSETLSLSKTNGFEADLVAVLLSHLVRQGTYRAEDIAVLTPYLGQLQRIKKRLMSSFEIMLGDRDVEDLEAQGVKDDDTDSKVNVQKTSLNNAVRVATVDNFQGEEAKVIIVSLVRSNEERKCGFLKTSNRINVLLSRARHGMYIIGNAHTANSVPMWSDVITILEQHGNIGQTLTLCCPRHKETLIEVSKPDDFALFSPEGGCSRKCSSRLLCGHACPNKCHAEPLHNAVHCLERCPRLKKGCLHSCPRSCGDLCEEKCQVKIPNVALPCGHVREWLACHQAQAPDTVSCQVQVQKTMRHCKHKVKVRCFELPLADDYPCGAMCGAHLPCGHNCKRPCKDCTTRVDGGRVNIDHGVCNIQCDRQYSTCSHTCTSSCHGNTPCQLCVQPCEVRCSHSKCSKKCQEPCVPCVENCSWSCPHRGQCQMPCAVPCDLLPCSERCPKVLICGHQCPSVCGEVCPEVQYCQECADPSVKERMVDYIMGYSYADVDLNESPCIIPSCGHLLTLESMDGHMSMLDFYKVSQEPSNQGHITGLRSQVEPFSVADLKKCPMCRGPLRNINRYGRIIRRAWIDEATKKFIVWANARFVPLAVRMKEQEEKLRTSRIQGKRSTLPLSVEELVSMKPIPLKGSRDQQIKEVRAAFNQEKIKSPLFQLRQDIKQFLKQVDEKEQPFSRIYDLVQDARIHRGIDTEMIYQPEVLQTRNRLLTTALLLRCDYAILLNFLSLKDSGQQAWTSRTIELDLKDNRKDCQDLIEEARARTQPANVVEGQLYWARFVALERGVREPGCSDMPRLVAEARAHLQDAKQLCRNYPSQTAGVIAEIEEVEAMLRDSTFYMPVTNAEKAAVYKAMALNFRGTGHWYYCANGHPFTIDGCGMPMETARCPQCDSPIGGQNHQPIQGVTRATDMEMQFGRLAI